MTVDLVEVSAAIAERAHELLAEARVVLFEGRPGVALVAGREGAYVVRRQIEQEHRDRVAIRALMPGGTT